MLGYRESNPGKTEKNSEAGLLVLDRTPGRLFHCFH